MADVRCARNNTGKSPVACRACVPHLCRYCIGRLSFPISFGLGEGGPDIVGFFRLRYRSSVLPVWFGLEVKTPHGAARKANPDILIKQAAWKRAARGWGVLVEQVTSPELAVVAVQGFQLEYHARLGS